jgi:hypothetical protein
MHMDAVTRPNVMLRHVVRESVSVSSVIVVVAEVMVEGCFNDSAGEEKRDGFVDGMRDGPAVWCRTHII